MQLLAAILVCHARAWSPLSVRSSGQTRVPKASIRRPTELSTADDASSATIMDSIASMPSTSGWGDRTVGGVRLDRISRLVVSGGVAYGAYVVGNDSLDVAIVEVLGDRSVGAFGPFVTLLALIYSTILGSIFSELSSRQGAIQDSLFAEAFAVRDVGEVCGIVSRNSESDLKEARQAILAHAETLGKVSSVFLRLRRETCDAGVCGRLLATVRSCLYPLPRCTHRQAIRRMQVTFLCTGFQYGFLREARRKTSVIRLHLRTSLLSVQE